MSKGKFKFNGVQKQKGRPTIVNGIEGQRYVVNKYLENLMSQQAVGRSDDYRVYTSVSNYQEYDAFADESLTSEQQQGAGGPGYEGQQDWSGQQEQPMSDEQRWSQQGYDQQVSGQQPGMQDSQSGQPPAYDQQMSGQQPGMQDSTWGQQGFPQQQSSTQQPAINESPWGQPQEQDSCAPAQQQIAQDQPWGTPPAQSVAQPLPQPISQSNAQDQVQSREQQSSSQSMLRNLFSESQSTNQVAGAQTQPPESSAPPQPSPLAEHSIQESQNREGDQSAPVQRNSQEIEWAGPQSTQQQASPQLAQENKQPQQQQPQEQQQQQQQSQQPLAPLQPPQHQFAQLQQQTGNQRGFDPQEQQQWHRVPQHPQPVQPQSSESHQIQPQLMQPQAVQQQAMQQPMQVPDQQSHQEAQQSKAQSGRREQAPKTMMFEKPRPKTNEMARIRRTQDGFEVTRTQQAMKKLDQQFFAAEEALNATFPMPNAKGMKRQQEKKNKNVVKSVRGTVEFLVHANGRTFTPTYNMVGVLTAVEVSDGFFLTRGERGDSPWTMTDKAGNSVEEDPIVGVAFDKKGNLWYETADGRRTTFNVDGTTKTAMKD